MQISDESINFFDCLTALSFSFIGLTGAFEMIKMVKSRAQEMRYFRSILNLGALLIISSLLPLALSDCDSWLSISTFWLFGAGLVMFSHLLYEIFSKKVEVQNKFVSIILFSVSAVFLALLFVNGVCCHKIIIYKISLLWLAFALGFRFYLFIRHISQLEKN